MPKKARVTLATSAPAFVTKQAQISTLMFPDLSKKADLRCSVLLEDQIFLIDGVLDTEECKRLTKFVDTLPLELTPPKKRGEADRVNYRFSVNSPAFAQRLHELLLPHLPSFPSPKRGASTDRKPAAMNSNIRVYRYDPEQYFGAHYDDSVRDAVSGLKSEWTLLIYLTGEEDGVEGGETLFYREQKGKTRETITPPLRRGMALLHRHGNDCMLHEGSPVRAGRKYVLRSDLLFGA